jgi:hypothetical protein
MKVELADSFRTIPATQEPREVRVEDGPLHSFESPYLAICEISAAAFQLSTRRQDHEVFTTSLYEIDRLLEDADPWKTSPDPLEEQRLAQVSKAKELAGITQDLAHMENKAHHPPEEDEFTGLPALYQEYRDVASRAESNKLPPHRSYDH